MALRPVLVDTKDKQLSANWGKQWGKHYAHFDTFLCIGLLSKIAETIDFTAFQSIVKKYEAIKLDPSGPRANKNALYILQGIFICANEASNTEITHIVPRKICSQGN
jgi:hypothetical protein